MISVLCFIYLWCPFVHCVVHIHFHFVFWYPENSSDSIVWPYRHKEKKREREIHTIKCIIYFEFGSVGIGFSKSYSIPIHYFILLTIYHLRLLQVWNVIFFSFFSSFVGIYISFNISVHENVFFSLKIIILIGSKMFSMFSRPNSKLYTFEFLYKSLHVNVCLCAWVYIW